MIGFVGKGGKQRSVALPPQALQIITEYLASNGAVPRASDPLIRKQDGSGEALSYYVINRVVTRWTKRHLGVRLTPPKLRPDDCRVICSPGSQLIRGNPVSKLRWFERVYISRSSCARRERS